MWPRLGEVSAAVRRATRKKMNQIWISFSYAMSNNTTVRNDQITNPASKPALAGAGRPRTQAPDCDREFWDCEIACLTAFVTRATEQAEKRRAPLDAQAARRSLQAHENNLRPVLGQVAQLLRRLQPPPARAERDLTRLMEAACLCVHWVHRPDKRQTIGVRLDKAGSDARYHFNLSAELKVYAFGEC